MSLRKRILIIVGLVLGVLVVGIGVYAYIFLQRDAPRVEANVRDHFKYGSIGSDRLGVPFWIWRVLPDLFPEYLPDRPGEGYARVGFIYEPGSNRQRPIGVSFRQKPVPLVGLNCSVCHTGTLRDSPDAPRQIIVGMPGHQFDLQAYIRFLFASANDDRFNADTLIPAIQQANPNFSFIERIFYRFLLIPRTKQALIDTGKTFIWMDNRPDSGPGAVDTFNPFNQFFGFNPSADNTVGTADLPSLWNQRIRIPMELHWDGNNRSVDERNINAAIGAGGIVGMQEAIDLEGIGRVADWALDLPPPAFPSDRIDAAKAEEGKAVYDTYCAACHAPDGHKIGQVTPIWEVGTDPERLRSFTPALVEELNKTGEGQPWAYSHFRKTDGYANMLLDGIWLRAPYLHNGSVPTLRDLLNPPSERPEVFYRAYDVYDYENIGFASSGPDAEREGVIHDTKVRGKGNYGHEYGTNLTPRQKDALLEYLKTQ